MSCSIKNQEVVVVAESTIVLLAQVVDTEDNYAIQADVESIEVVTNEIDGSDVTQVGETDEPLVADTIYDTLQTDSRWTKDSIGYNLAYKTSMPERDKQYEVRIKLNMDNGDTLVALFPNIKAR